MQNRRQDRLHKGFQIILVLMLAHQLVWGSIPMQAYAEALDALGDTDEVVLDSGALPGDGQADASALQETLDALVRDCALDLREEAGNDDAALVKALFNRLVSLELTDEAVERALAAAEGTEAQVDDGAVMTEAEELDEAIAALNGEQATPEGIAFAFAAVTEELGLDVQELEGADGATWYLVALDGGWYHVDPASAAQDLALLRDAMALEAQPALGWLMVSDDDLREAAPGHSPWKLAADEDAVVPAADESFDWDIYEEQAAEAEAVAGEDAGEAEAVADEGSAESEDTAETPVEEDPTDAVSTGGDETATTDEDASDTAEDGEGEEATGEAVVPQVLDQPETDEADSGEHPFGDIPLDIVAKSIHDENEEGSLITEASLDATYDSRKKGYVTAVKDQSPYGSCWSFAAMAACESSLLRRNSLGYTSSSLNLSERHLAYFTYNSVADPLGTAASDKTSISGDTYLNFGGSQRWASMALANWYGVVSEGTAPYSGAPSGLSSTLAYTRAIARVTGVRFIPMTDRADIKTAIMNYGAVATSMYYDDAYFDDSRDFYRYSGSNGTNHGVTLVGWSDYLSAWLVKNSWGTGFGGNGYFWISYYDSALNSSTTEATAYQLVSSSAYANEYKYDGTNNPAYEVEYSGVRVANVYTTKAYASGENLKAVSFWTRDTNVKYSIQIYGNLKNSSNPTSGSALLASPLTGTTSYEGYYTVSLPSNIPLLKGTKFSVVITLSHSNGNYVYCSFDESGYTKFDDGSSISFKSAVGAGQSFVRPVGGSWTNCYQRYGSDATARIKVFSNNANNSSYRNVANLTVNAIPAQKLVASGCKPAPTVKLGRLVLRRGTDYTVSYANNTKLGTGTCIIKGTGKYAGTKRVYFKIIFRDVATSAWYFNVVHTAAKLDLVNGYSRSKYGLFGPNDNITRGQVACILYNMAGKPSVGSGAKYFSDVKKGTYYYTAVRWCSARGVVSGVGNNKFKPNAYVTRQDLAVMIANYAKKVKHLNVTGSVSNIKHMTDWRRVSSYARTSVGWCFKKDIMSGNDGRVLPTNTATRAEAAKMLLALYNL